MIERFFVGNVKVYKIWPDYTEMVRFGIFYHLNPSSRLAENRQNDVIRYSRTSIKIFDAVRECRLGSKNNLTSSGSAECRQKIF